MSNFVGFKGGKSFVLDEHIEAVRLAKVSNGWSIIIYLRYPDGGKSDYTICRETSESEAKARLDSFMAQYSNVKYPIIILIGYISTCSYLLQNIDPVIMRVCLNPKLKKNVR